MLTIFGEIISRHMVSPDLVMVKEPMDMPPPKIKTTTVIAWYSKLSDYILTNDCRGI